MSEAARLSMGSRLLLASLVTAVGAGGAWLGYEAQEARKPEKKSEQSYRALLHEIEQTKLRADLKKEELRSSLEGLGFKIELARVEDGRPVLKLRVVKPFGKEWIVQSPQHHSFGFVEGKERGALSDGPKFPGTLIRLQRRFNDHLYHMPVPFEVKPGQALVVEWRVKDPRSGKEEMLRSNELIMPAEKKR